MSSKIDFKKISDALKLAPSSAAKAIWSIGKRAFWLSMLLILIDLIIGGLVFYKYVFSAENDKSYLNNPPLQFDEKSYKEILSQWGKRDESLNQFIQKDYPDPFQ